MKKGLIFAIALVVLLSATVITFARNTATESVSITAAGVGGFAAGNAQGASQAVATVKLKHSSGGSAPYTNVAPTWSPVVGQAGSITAGDIYYLDCSAYLGDVMVTINLTNPSALAKDYSYLNLLVNVWSGGAGTWTTQATNSDGSAIYSVGPPVIESFLNIINGNVTFILAGGTHYCITIDSGDYYCIDTNAIGGSLSPDFYLEIKPL